MKFGLLQYSRSRNFGDQIQSLAAKRFLPQVDEFLDRDYLNQYESPEPIKLIMNGWYMARPENWPPSVKIKPLLTSFHITHDYDAYQKLFSPEALEFYKKNEPIGCRDYYTKQLMEANGIEAYYSGCLTLTLNKQLYIASPGQLKRVLVVDVLYKVGGGKLKFFENWKRNWLIKQIIAPEILAKSEFITQVVPKGTSEEEKFLIAEEALKKYAQADLVITSRIHCALPCVAFNTPVIFIDGALDDNTDTTRLHGIEEYFNSYKIHNVIKSYRGFFKELFSGFVFKNPLDINWENPDPNPTNHLPVVEDLKESCKKFINDD